MRRCSVLARRPLPFRVIPGPPFATAQYEGEVSIPQGTIRQTYSLQRGPVLDAVLSMMEMYHEVERERDGALAERDAAMARAINAEAELAKSGDWKKGR